MSDDLLPNTLTNRDASVANAAADSLPTLAAEATLEPGGASAPPLDAVHTSGRSQLRLAFTGRAGDYFRIWIVNLLLTLVTMGLWSPWAKVRKRRYFYGHSWLANANFEYHGNPVLAGFQKCVILGV